MPVILSDDTWSRIEKMLTDYESGVLRVIPGSGMKFEEQVTPRASCPGTKIGIDRTATDGFPTINLNVCVGGVGVSHQFLVKL